MSEKLKEMREGVKVRRRHIDENKEGKDYTEALKGAQKNSSLRYRQKKSEQKTKDDLERPQSKITDGFEVKED